MIRMGMTTHPSSILLILCILSTIDWTLFAALSNSTVRRIHLVTTQHPQASP